ncbi:MAG: DUF4153 domain-containing protein [Saprospiraceae bacterium]
MQFLSSFNEIFTKAKSSFLRFPITILWAIAGTVFTTWFVEQEFLKKDEIQYIRLILTFVLGVSWLIGTRLLVHFFKEEKGQKKTWLIILPLLFLTIYYFSLPTEQSAFENLKIPYRFVLFFLTGHLFVFFSAFIFSWDKRAYWNYLKNIVVAFTTSVLFSMALYLGLILAIMALKFLFQIDIHDKIYFELFIFCLGIINTWIFVSDLENQVQSRNTINYPNALLVFVKYILVPLTLLYLIILYAYSAKILFNWSLPKGWVSYLVVALSILGFVIHILINPIRKTIDSKIIKGFYPWFYIALLPLIGLLFVSIYTRISAYGFTENRYFVLLLACWILGMTIYLLVSKRKKLKYFPMSVAILSMFASFGIWGAFSVSNKSQISEFKSLYSKIKANDFNVTNEEKLQFNSISQYLNERKLLPNVSDVLGFDPTKVFKTDEWNIVNKLSDTLDMKVTDIAKLRGKLDNAYFNAKYNEPLYVKGYDYVGHIYFDSYEVNRSTKSVEPFNKILNYNFRLRHNPQSEIIITKENDTIHHIDMTPMINALLKTNTGTSRYGNNSEIDQKIMTIIEEYDDMKLKIYFTDIQLKTKTDSTNTTPKVISCGATVLIKEK